MSRLYGTVSGMAETEASRRGNDYIRVSAQSWTGSLITTMTLSGDTPIVTLQTTSGSDSWGGRQIFRGSLDDLDRKLSQQFPEPSEMYVDVFDRVTCILNHCDQDGVSVDEIGSALRCLQAYMSERLS